MTPGVHLVNIARGALVDQDALRVALDDGPVAMATLDTVDPEPLPDGHWLYAHPKVRLTAHISWYTPAAAGRRGRHLRRRTSAASDAASRCCTSSIPTRATECRARSSSAPASAAGCTCPRCARAGFAVHALVGRDAARTRRRAERLGIPHVCTSLGDALALAGVDAVTIATPPDTHASLAIEACEAGRHVVCEKPFALDADEAERMLAAAERAGVTHLVGHEFRWAPDRALVARAIARRR